jgi:glutathione-regulated potassium-efflux system ancillary protein KefC
LKALAMLAAVVFAGHFLLRFLLRVIKRTGVPEVFTAFALL